MAGPEEDPHGDFAGVVLAGGAGRRLAGHGGGGSKPAARVAGRAMLRRVVDALAGAREVVVAVGGAGSGAGARGVVLPSAVIEVRDALPGGGPVAGLAAALTRVTAPVTVVLAADLPLVDAAVVARLRGALAAAGPQVDAAVPVDAGGRRQHLAAAYRTGALREAVAAGDPQGRSWRDLLAGLRVAEFDPGPLSGRLLDVDTPEDLARARMTEWSSLAARRLSTGLSPEDVLAVIPPVLDIAKDVAHGVARPAAPVTTFLVGIALGRALATDTAPSEMGEELEDLLARVRAALPARQDEP